MFNTPPHLNFSTCDSLSNSKYFNPFKPFPNCPFLVKPVPPPEPEYCYVPACVCCENERVYQKRKMLPGYGGFIPNYQFLIGRTWDPQTTQAIHKMNNDLAKVRTELVLHELVEDRFCGGSCSLPCSPPCHSPCSPPCHSPCGPPCFPCFPPDIMEFASGDHVKCIKPRVKLEKLFPTIKKSQTFLVDKKLIDAIEKLKEPRVVIKKVKAKKQARQLKILTKELPKEKDRSLYGATSETSETTSKGTRSERGGKTSTTDKSDDKDRSDKSGEDKTGRKDKSGKRDKFGKKEKLTDEEAKEEKLKRAVKAKIKSSKTNFQYSKRLEGKALLRNILEGLRDVPCTTRVRRCLGFTSFKPPRIPPRPCVDYKDPCLALPPCGHPCEPPPCATPGTSPVTPGFPCLTPPCPPCATPGPPCATPGPPCGTPYLPCATPSPPCATPCPPCAIPCPPCDSPCLPCGPPCTPRGTAYEPCFIPPRQFGLPCIYPCEPCWSPCGMINFKPISTGFVGRPGGLIPGKEFILTC